MAKTLDIKKVKAALKEAAKAAGEGPPEAQAGRFTLARDPETGRYVSESSERGKK